MAGGLIAILSMQLEFDAASIQYLKKKGLATQ